MTRLPVVRVDLGDGDYADVAKYMLIRTQNAVREYCEPYKQEDGQLTAVSLAGLEQDLFGLFFEGQVEQLRISYVRRYRLFGLVFRRLVRRTFNPPFKYEAVRKAMDDVGAVKLQILEKEMNKLYMPDPLAVAPSSSPSPTTPS